MDYSLSYGHHDLRPCSTHLVEGTVSMGQATGPIYTCETTGHAPVTVLDAHPQSAAGAPYQANLHPTPRDVWPAAATPSLSSSLDSMQANGKSLVSSTHAQTTTMVHGTDGPTSGRAEDNYVGLASKAKLQGR